MEENKSYAYKEKLRKCFQCGSSPAQDSVTLFRFPKPGQYNIWRCQSWAKFMFPDRPQDWCSTVFLTKLHKEHKMLCQKHFKDVDFKDPLKRLLVPYAVPEYVKYAKRDVYYCSEEPQASPSQRQSLGDISNISGNTTVEIVKNVTAEPQTVPSQKGSTRDIINIPRVPNIEPGTSQTPKVVLPSNTTEKEKALYMKCRKYMKTICRLQKRIKDLKSKDVLDILNKDIHVNKLCERLSPTFALLLQAQIRNFKKKVTGHRWTQEEKIVALRIYKRSPACYRLLRRMFNMPAPATLKFLLNKVPFDVGINRPVFEVLKKYVLTQNSSNNEYLLMFDEMSIKKHLYYNPRGDMIEGYQDHASQERSPLIASYALVFMISGIRRKVKQPIAHYFSSGSSTADRLAVLIKEVLRQCFEAGINIAAIVCDMDGVNRRALSILGASAEHPSITVDDKEMITIFDTPHLLKCFRNLFMKYDIECTSNISSNNQTGKGVAKWAHVKEFYEADNTNPNFVYAPCLKKEHLNPNTKQKMKVKLAAQLLSHSVAGGMFAKIGLGELPAEATVTANLISKMDKLFDSLNSDCSDLRRGKPYATNLRRTTPHLQLFEEMRVFFRDLKFIGCARRPPSQDGWIWTLNGIEQLWRNLVQKHNITSLATRRLQQDPLENLFGCIRGNCGSNTNPTCGQFVAGLKTAILTNLATIGATGNCERDNSVVISNFQTLLSVKPTNKCAEPEFLSSEFDFNIESVNEGDSSEIQACAYVCGFISKRIINNTCQNCKNALLSDTVQTCHIFTEFREYSEEKKSLNYVARDFIAFVENCASIINNFLNDKGHTTSLKKYILECIKNTVNFEFLNKCLQHKNENVNNILNSVFFICVKRFCIVKNREFSEESSATALKRKMNIIMHK